MLLLYEGPKGYIFKIVVSVLLIVEVNGSKFDHIIFKSARQIQQSLVPLPREVWQSTAQCTAALYLPVLADPGPCQTHSQYTLSRVLEGDSWALSMLDSSSRPGPGLMEGLIQNMGNYDQCLRVIEPDNHFVTQHCEVNLRGVLPHQLEHFYGKSGIGLSFPAGHILFMLCVPSSCSADDVLTHITRTLSAANVILPSSAELAASCNDIKWEVFWSKPSTMRTKDWFALILVIALVSLVILSTCYDQKKTRNKSAELLTSFSLVSNWRELTRPPGREDVRCLDGLRVWFALRVLITHRILISYHTPILSLPSLHEQKRSIFFAMLANGSLASEAFFVINGVTRSYNFLRDRLQGKPHNHLHSSIRRYFRVTPLMGVVIVYACTLAPHISDGPVHVKGTVLEDLLCSWLWILSIFHISNFMILYRCRGENWFIAADYQLFLLSPLVLLPLSRAPEQGLRLLTALFTLTTFIKMICSHVNLYFADTATLEGEFPLRKMSLGHYNTLFRVPPFIIGIVVGYVLFQMKYSKKRKIVWLSKWTVRLGWTLCVLVLAATPVLNSVNLNPDYEDSAWFSTFFVGLWEQVFAAAIGWIILSCSSGYGGWTNSVLSHRVLHPLAKLSFSFYLSHMSLQSLHIFRSRVPTRFDLINIIHLCVADSVVTLLIATVLFLLVENPCNRLTNHLLQAANHPRDKKKNG